MMDNALRGLVRRRANGAREYCRLPQAAAPIIGFHVEVRENLQAEGEPFAG